MDDHQKIKKELAEAGEKIQHLESLVNDAGQKTKVVRMAQAFLHEITSTLTQLTAPVEFLNKFHLKELKTIYSEVEQYLSEKQRIRFVKNLNKIDKYVKVISRGSEKIRTMAEFSKGSLPSDEKARDNVYLSFVLDGAIEASGKSGTGCAFNVEIPDDFIVWGNSILLERVFANLITNSLEAMSGQDDKEIILHCSYREINAVKVAYFEFSDKGRGIPQPLREIVFSREYSTKNSGHGLPVCREIIEGFHGGKIEVQDDATNKSKFVFWIPFAKNTSIKSDSEKEAHPEIKNMMNANKDEKPWILIIEDYKDIREILQEKFEEWQLKVSCAKSVEEAQRLIDRREWKIVFVNMGLPPQSRGIDLIKAIRHRWPNTTIFAMSGDHDKNLKQEALAAGAIDFLRKPDDLLMDPFDKKVKPFLEMSTT